MALVASLLLTPAARAQTEDQEDQGVVVVPTSEIWDVDAFSIQDDYFKQTYAVVDPGTTLTWVNRGQEQHAVTAGDGQFDFGVLDCSPRGTAS
jgi:plastocyanin